MTSPSSPQRYEDLMQLLAPDMQAVDGVIRQRL
ncbi:MAG: hypothetical protein RL446_444, partial [Pseudomonadota bacterium]